MKFLDFLKKSKYLAILVLAVLIQFTFIHSIWADSMQSGTYKIQFDSLNLGGADGASSAYKLNDTLGEIGTGNSNSSTYYMHAGYWQMGESYISISSPSDLIMTSMAGLSGGSSEGTMSWTVTTDNLAGYSMSLSASTTPALKSANDSLSDYVPSGSNPDYNFTNLPANSTFGFSPEGTDVIPRFRDNGVACNTGSSETTGKCWDGLSTTPKVIASNTTSNHPSGSIISARFRAESGVNHVQSSGTYNVTITATATTL